MNTVVRLKIASPGARGPWSVRLDDLEHSAVEETLTAEETARIASAVLQGVRPLPGRRGVSPVVGQALARVLSSRERLAKQLPFLLGPATGRAGRPALVVDVEGELAQWPWELLAGSPEQAPLEHTRRASIARLAPGPKQPARDEAAHRLRVIYWCGVPGDGSNAERVAALEALLQTLSRSDALEYGSAVDAPRPPDRPVATVLHIVAGENDDVIGHIVGADSSQGGGYIASSWLRGVDLVLLDIAEGASSAGHEWARRVVAAGGPACIAPTSRCSTDSAKVFVGTLYERLLAQDSLADAVSSARADQVRRAPGGGWHALYVGDASVLQRKSLIEQRWRPEGWPGPSPAASNFLHRAFQLAQQSGVGFVGLEHLAMALEGDDELPPNAAALREVLVPRGDELRRRLAGLVPTPDRAADWRGTARLRAYGPLLPPDLDIDDVWELVAADNAHALHEVAGRPLATVLTSNAAASLRPVVWSPDAPDVGRDVPIGLQIAGGPEDGEILHPTEGDIIGRASEGVRLSFPLYARTLLVDRRLSRRHVKWVGAGRVMVVRRARVRRGASEHVLQPGEFQLEPGDLLRLTRSTRLRVLSRED